MIQKITLLALLFALTKVQAQFKITESNAVTYQIQKEPKFQTFQVDGKEIFAMKNYENAVANFNLLVLDKDNNLSVNAPIKYNMGIFTNSTYINSLHQVGNGLVALFENTNKGEGKNSLSIKSLSTNGVLGNTLKDLDFIPYTRMMQPGDWLSCTTPDKQHLAIIALFPPEKGVAQKGRFYFLDASLNVISSGDFNIGTEKRKSFYFKFAASNAGDMYLINEESEKGYIFPVVYRKAAADKAFTEFVVALKDPLKISNYTYGISPTGSFVVAGYSKEKQGFISNGDARTNGIWVYNTDKPSEIAHHMFEKIIPNLEARTITFNGNKLFLVGEQVWKTQEMRPAGSFENNYTYKYENVVITGYDMEANTKFDLQMNRKFTSRNFTADLSAASGIVDNKFVLLYNDELAKYMQGASSYYRVPVTVGITDAGLMESPYHYEKELKSYSSFTLLPFFTSITNNQITILANSGNQVKAIRMK